MRNVFGPLHTTYSRRFLFYFIPLINYNVFHNHVGPLAFDTYLPLSQ